MHKNLFPKAQERIAIKRRKKYREQKGEDENFLLHFRPSSSIGSEVVSSSAAATAVDYWKPVAASGDFSMTVAVAGDSSLAMATATATACEFSVSAAAVVVF